MKRMKRIGLGVVALLLGAAIWLPLLHFVFMPNPANYRCASSGNGLPPKARALAERHLALWTNPNLREAELAKMRVRNAEWDFMGRTFLVLALTNMSLREPEKQAAYLEIVDRIIDETIKLEHEESMYFFLMPYAKSGRFCTNPPRSMFIDGEIALMIAARRMVAERADYAPLLRERVDAMTDYMKTSLVLAGESYPDECWMFCNTLAITAIRMHDILDGTDHSQFIADWLAMVKRQLTDPATGMVVSSFTRDGIMMDGPEGSTIWMVAHCFQVIDEDFANDQYRRAREHLGECLLGFGYAREWPETGDFHKFCDVDSGPIIPIVDASAGSSGMAFVAAAAFHDDDFMRSLLTSLDFSAFPLEKDGRRKYCASNQVGDAVLLYAMVEGPLWNEVRQRGATLEAMARGEN